MAGAGSGRQPDLQQGRGGPPPVPRPADPSVAKRAN